MKWVILVLALLWIGPMIRGMFGPREDSRKRSRPGSKAIFRIASALLQAGGPRLVPC